MHTHNGIFWKSGILDSGFLRTYLIHAIDNNIIEKLRYKMHKPNKMVHLGLWAQRFTKVLRENLELHQISRLLGMSIIWDNKQEGINRRSEIKRQEAKLWFLKIPKISKCETYSSSSTLLGDNQQEPIWWNIKSSTLLMTRSIYLPPKVVRYSKKASNCSMKNSTELPKRQLSFKPKWLTLPKLTASSISAG